MPFNIQYFSFNDERDYILAAAAASALLLIMFAGVARYFKVVNTLFHETGHAVFTLLSSGTIHKIELSKDSSGITMSGNLRKVGKVITALAGYPFASGFAVLLFYFVSTNRIFEAGIVITAITVINLLFWVRNTFGIVWLILFAGIQWALYYLNLPLVSFFYIALAAFLLLFESLAKAWTQFRLSVTQSSQSGDAYLLQKLLVLPAFFWAMVFLMIALLCLYLSLCFFFSFPFFSLFL
ncbi:MAG: M50 family metallopeptidase [Bacteroidetes bacterium]|nr:M50 family metallopeptidase [Bacteroidota bacterium]